MISHALAYHMSYTASFICIGAILVPLYCWYMFARTQKGNDSSKMHDLGRWIAVELDESEEDDV